MAKKRRTSHVMDLLMAQNGSAEQQNASVENKEGMTEEQREQYRQAGEKTLNEVNKPMDSVQSTAEVAGGKGGEAA